MLPNLICQQGNHMNYPSHTFPTYLSYHVLFPTRWGYIIILTILFITSYYSARPSGEASYGLGNRLAEW